jgi:hypothetical protein
MTRNFKPLIIGVIAFLAGQAIATYVVYSAGSSSGGGTLANAIWLTVQFAGYLVAVIAAALASYSARENRVWAGVGAVIIGAILFALPGIIGGRQSLPLILMALAMFGFFAWLGAIIGAYAAKRRGT